MRLASYLCTSRHGIFYFRYPVPAACHPQRKRTHIKVSLGTREPRVAAQLSRLLAVSGQSIFSAPKVRTMRYDEIRRHVREHYEQLLASFREKVAAEGPLRDENLDGLRASQKLLEDDAELFAKSTHQEGEEGLLRAFCDARGVTKYPKGGSASCCLLSSTKVTKSIYRRPLRTIVSLTRCHSANRPARPRRSHRKMRAKHQQTWMPCPTRTFWSDTLQRLTEPMRWPRKQNPRS